MSFFQKLTKKLDEFKLDGGDDHEHKKDKYEARKNDDRKGLDHLDRSHPSQYHDGPAPRPYGNAPGSSGETAPANPPADRPPLPAGWVPQWSQQYQRWYYVEEATGRSQWEAPVVAAFGYSQPAGAGGYDANYHGDHRNVDPSGHTEYSDGGDPYGHEAENKEKDKKKDKSSSKNALLAAGAGLAVGAVGGYLIADALADNSSSHDDADGGQVPPAALPPVDADGNSVSGSDAESVREAREDMEEARNDYEEALEAANDSGASSSDEEELEEAREEYEEGQEEFREEYEETYKDDD